MIQEEKFIEELIKERNRLRNTKKFKEADLVRDKIDSLGYEIIDGPVQTSFKKKSFSEEAKMKITSGSFLILFGSGEISSIGRSIHDFVLQKINKTGINISIISTPAGFQPNVVSVHEEIADFFKNSLSNYHPRVSIIYANNKRDANNPYLVKSVDDADYIFIGPGSPTYATKNLADTLLLSKIKNSVKKGKTLCLSSAAVLAFSRHTLPVYEIYKVGSKLYWESGLDYLSKIMNNSTVIPHKNNNEGGIKLDTSFCFMGEARFRRLRKLLPQNEKVLGIDEHTAVIVDLLNKSQVTMGKGNVYNL